ncbi:zinc finger CCHC domain-containing protein 24-like [Zerene cesonia]|uniref:zinc finger CCHC domain-containing protein 24-like n=1 Tax=Zerene cesonia TaxID=33412 RepID=UPI0018E51EC2|nr:zinc finger CCHC domain-containing protein 24-like [Zerene cesonia]
MGCFWSKENYQRCTYCNRNAVNESNDICQICKDVTQSGTYGQLFLSDKRPHQNRSDTVVPFFGEYKCKSCGRFWNSRLCWPDSYQLCKTCSKPVYAYYFRALHSSDLSNSNDNTKEHPKELCEKCKQQGHYCGAKRSIQ